MKFAKTLVAAALLAGTGAAQASIGTGTSAEAFLEVYDSSQQLTYDLDLGVAFTTLIGASATALHYNLATDANWTSFVSKLNAATTSYGVVAGNGGTKLAFTTNNDAAPLAGGSTSESQASGQIKIAAGRINIGDASAISVNNSKLVTDANADQGGWADAAGSANTLDNLWGTVGATSAGIAYGSNGNFIYDYFNGTTKTNASTQLGYWNLSGSTLDYNLGTVPAPAAVPLPAAAWMFGAALMGMLGVNRRKAV